ncbi:MAG: ATP synthase subunit I [Deltaproteobacteria bacterium]|nr:ATP synthase subunit I [Deltaproteobacteria bacterium]
MSIFYLFVVFMAGIGIGVFYFGGLWVTVRRLPTTRHPALWTLGSFMGRTGMSLLGFYAAMGGRWERLLACLFGFLLARHFLVRRWRTGKTHLVEKKRVDEWV